MKFLRWKAKQLGWTLNEYGMGKKYEAIYANPNGFVPGTLKEVKDEKEIFELLKLPYIRRRRPPSLTLASLMLACTQLKPEERDYHVWKEKYLAAGAFPPAQLYPLRKLTSIIFPAPGVKDVDVLHTMNL